MGCGDKVQTGQPSPYSGADRKTPVSIAETARRMDAQKREQVLVDKIFGVPNTIGGGIGGSLLRPAVKVEMPRGMVVIEREPSQPAPLPPVRNVQLNLPPNVARALRHLLQHGVSSNYSSVINPGSVYGMVLAPLAKSLEIVQL